MKTYTKEEYIEIIQVPPNFHRDTVDKPKYAIGDTIMSANLNPSGHTRLPRYARAKKGIVMGNYGACIFPDSLVANGNEHPQYVYLVKFSSEELWGKEAGNFTVNLSLFDEYISGKC